MRGKSLWLSLALSLGGVSLALFPTRGRAQTPEAIYLILDASGSMMGQLPDRSRKIEVAKQVLQEFVTRDFTGYELALRVYGHRRKEDCADSELLIPFGPPEQAVAQIQRALPQIKALGHTPITYSLREALKDFGDRRGEIILISDGIESCDADPCALVREWQNRNVKIRVHVVGFGLDEKAKETLRCISQAAGTEYTMPVRQRRWRTSWRRFIRRASRRASGCAVWTRPASARSCTAHSRATAWRSIRSRAVAAIVSKRASIC